MNQNTAWGGEVRLETHYRCSVLWLLARQHRNLCVLPPGSTIAA